MTYVDERPVLNDVRSPRWFQVGSGMSHAFLLPAGDLPDGKIRAVCPLSATSDRMSAPGSKRCKTCTKGADMTEPKYGTGLTEPNLPIVDKGATAAPTIGARDGGGHMDGPALVKGPNMAPVRPTWRNPKTGEIEPAAAYLDGSLRDRLDRTVADERPKGRRSNASKRRYRARQSSKHWKAQRNAS